MAEKESRQEKLKRKEETRRKFLEFEKTGDPKLREELITEHLYIAEILAKKYVNRGIEYDDLLQVASVGLIYAIDRYDVHKGYEFSSFATPTIDGELKRHFRDKGWVIRVPRRIQELTKRVNNARLSLAQEMQDTPTAQDIAGYLEISTEEVLEAMEASKVYSPQSLDKTFDSASDDRETNLGDLIGIEDSNFETVDLQDVIERMLSSINELERKILYYRYYEKRTQISIAEELGISQMTVSRIEKKIIQKFRNELDIDVKQDRK